MIGFYLKFSAEIGPGDLISYKKITKPVNPLKPGSTQMHQWTTYSITIGSHNGLSTVWCQTIAWPNTVLMPIAIISVEFGSNYNNF